MRKHDGYLRAKNHGHILRRCEQIIEKRSDENEIKKEGWLLIPPPPAA
jgi:hypothetical protein